MEHIFNYKGKKFLLSIEDRYPIYPYRYERTINKEKAYLIDKNGIIWILTHLVINNKDYGLCYYDGCLRECVTYITMFDGFYNYLNVKKFIREHLDGKEKYYNKFLGKYDNLGINICKKE